MPYEGLAVKLLEAYAKEGSFEVDYMDTAMTENVVKHLADRGCIVVYVGHTRIRVTCPAAMREESRA